MTISASRSASLTFGWSAVSDANSAWSALICFVSAPLARPVEFSRASCAASISAWTASTVRASSVLVVVLIWFPFGVG